MEKEPKNAEITSESISESTLSENNINIVSNNSEVHECEYDNWYSE